MKTILNLITIAFVLASLVIVVVNNNVIDMFSRSYKNAVSEIKALQPMISGQLSTNTDNLKTYQSTTSKIPKVSTGKVVLPGPLTKNNSNAGSIQNESTTKDIGALTISGIISDTNLERTNRSISTLTESHELDASAKVKANDILQRQYFEHTSPDGKKVSDLATAQGYYYVKIGENLALGDFKNDADVLSAWMASPGHKANILDPKYMDIGVGVAYGTYKGQQVYVAVQHFGRPRSSCPSIDSNLKKSVESLQNELTNMATSLDNLKKQIDQGSANGTDVNNLINQYNQGVDAYQKEFAVVDSLRTKFNAEVGAFNSCIDSLQ